MSKFPSQELDRFNVRLPAGMREAIAERAKANGRSMNAEIVQILQDALEGKYSPIDRSSLEGVSFIHADQSGMQEYNDAEKIARYIELRAEQFKKSMIEDLTKFSSKKPT